jgi:hypothetical protein
MNIRIIYEILSECKEGLAQICRLHHRHWLMWNSPPSRNDLSSRLYAWIIYLNQNRDIQLPPLILLPGHILYSPPPKCFKVCWKTSPHLLHRARPVPLPSPYPVQRPRCNVPYLLTPNVVGELSKTLPRIREDPGSIFGLGDRLSRLMFFSVFLSPSRRTPK